MSDDIILNDLDFPADPEVVIDRAYVLRAVFECALTELRERGTTDVATRAGLVFELKTVSPPTFGPLPPFDPAINGVCVIVDRDDSPLCMVDTRVLVNGKNAELL